MSEVQWVYSWYKPIAEDDTDTICALMGLYRTYYQCIGLIIAVIGVGLTLLFLTDKERSSGWYKYLCSLFIESFCDGFVILAICLQK